MSEPENFLTRWSRKKRETEREAEQKIEQAPPAADATTRDQEPAAGETAVAENKEAEADLSKLPSLDSIAAETDITGFLQRGVPSDLTRAALQRAWATDPAIRDFIGIAENQYDFATGTGIPGFGPLNAADNVARMVADIAREGFKALEPTEAERAAAEAETPLEPHHSPVAEASQPLRLPEASEPASEGHERPAEIMPDADKEIVHRDKVDAAMQQDISDPEYSPLPICRPHGRALPE